MKKPEYAACDLREFIERLEKRGLMKKITAKVDPYLEIAEIHRRVVTKGGPALFFENVKNSDFPVVTNLFGTLERVELGFGTALKSTLEDTLELLHNPPTGLKGWLSRLFQKRSSFKNLLSIGFKKNRLELYPLEKGKMLNALPLITSWPMDGGAFVTLPLVYTTSKGAAGKSANLGMYRIQRFDNETAGLHFQIGKGAGFHLYEAEKRGEDMPVSLFLGGSPALIAGAIAPLPENVNELLLASALLGSRLPISKVENWPHPLLSKAEFAICGRAMCGKRRLEGPFGDHYGYYSLAHEFPYMKVEKVYARKGAIYPATVVGKPPQEDLFLGMWLQDLLKPLIKQVMPGVRELWSYGESGFHALATASVYERYERESLTHALRILGEGQLSLTKFLLLTDQNIDVKDIRTSLSTVLERMRPERDLYILSNLCLDTLDYTGPSLNKGSRGILVGNGPAVRKLPSEFSQNLPAPFKQAKAFCPGCLLVEGLSYEADKEAAMRLTAANLQNWPLVILVDSIAESIAPCDFLWSVFLRFEPARDIYSRHSWKHYHAICELPLVIDARMKPSYPPIVQVDDVTKTRVDERWSEYFGSSGSCYKSKNQA